MILAGVCYFVGSPSLSMDHRALFPRRNVVSHLAVVQGNPIDPGAVLLTSTLGVGRGRLESLQVGKEKRDVSQDKNITEIQKRAVVPVTPG